MLNPPELPYIHPAAIDWTDSFNTLGRPGYSKNNNRYAFDSINDPAFMALRQAIGVEPRYWVCPDPIDQTVAGLSSIDYQVPSEPNTWVWGFNTSSNDLIEPDPASFLFQITDQATGATVFSSPQKASLYYPNKAKGVYSFLSSPRLFIPPSYPVVRIMNLSGNAQKCIVNLFCMIETDPQPIP